MSHEKESAGLWVGYIRLVDVDVDVDVDVERSFQRERGV